MASLVLDDPLEEVHQDRVPGARDQAVVRGERGELVHGAPRHVQRHEVLDQGGREQGGHVRRVSFPPSALRIRALRPSREG